MQELRFALLSLQKPESLVNSKPPEYLLMGKWVQSNKFSKSGDWL